MEVKDIVKIEWSNTPVVTTNQLAECLGCEPKNIANNFNRAKEYFEEGVDYFKLTGEALRQFKSHVTKCHMAAKAAENVPVSHSSKKGMAEVHPYAAWVYLWTHKGCVRHCKTVNTAAAWRMFNELERVYFGVLEGEITIPEGTIYPDIAAKPKIAQVENAELLNRIQKQFAKPCVELAIVYALLMSNLVVKIGYTSNPTERVKKIRAETKLEVIDFYSTRLMTLEEARTLEASLKEKYAAECIGGEYFDVRFSDVCAEL